MASEIDLIYVHAHMYKKDRYSSSDVTLGFSFLIINLMG